MLFAPRSVPVLICASSVHGHEEALKTALCFTYLHFCSVEAVLVQIKSELYNGGWSDGIPGPVDTVEVPLLPLIKPTFNTGRPNLKGLGKGHREQGSYGG